MQVEVIRNFTDKIANLLRKRGERFNCSPERAEQLSKFRLNDREHPLVSIVNSTLDEDIREEIEIQTGELEPTQEFISEVKDNVIEDLNKLSYRELQQIARLKGHKVNVKRQELIDLLSK
jgi:hypothetical protein